MPSGGSFGNATIDALDNNLKSYWMLDEASNSTRNDSVGSINLADVNTVAQSATAKDGFSADFIRANSEGLSSSTSLLNNQQGFVFSLWVRFDATGNDNMLLWEGTNGGAGARMNVRKLSGDTLFMFVRNQDGGSSVSATSTNTFSSGTWYHICAFFGGASLVAYVNGSKTNWIDSAVSVPQIENANALEPFKIGYGGSFGIHHDGLIDEVAYWDDVPGDQAAFATALYNGGTGRFWEPDASSSSSSSSPGLVSSSSSSSSSSLNSSSSSPSSASSASSNSSSSSSPSSLSSSSSSSPSSSSDSSASSASSASSVSESSSSSSIDEAEGGEDLLIRTHGEIMTIQDRTDTTQITGVRTHAWTTRLRAYLWKQPIGSSLRTQYEERQILVTDKFFCAVNPAVSEGDRIVDASGNAYLVHGVVDQAGLGRVWRIDAEEVK